MKSILSIQSHVAYGYVGNRAAVFPLQRMGHDVSAVHTVQFSNHTGYGAWTGEVFSPELVSTVIDGIADRAALDRMAALLSGYMGDATLGQVIVDTLARIRRANPAAVYCCDPVMGDVGRGFFVRPGIPEFMRDVAVPTADIITPNQFELEYLTGITVDSLETAKAAAAQARAMGPRHVLLTSLDRADAEPGTIEMMLACDSGFWITATPRLPINPAPNGAGDATAALFLGKFLETMDAVAALEHAASAIFAVFQATQRAGARELQLVTAQDNLVAPEQVFKAVAV